MEDLNAIYEVTEVSRVYDESGKDYPAYKVKRCCLGRYRHLEDAEGLVARRGANRYSMYDETILYQINLMPLDIETMGALKEYLYGEDGTLLDKWVQPLNGGSFEGRDPDECRFRPGDLCEMVNEDTVTLGIVATVPFTRKEVSARREKGVALSLDDMDVCQVIPFFPSNIIRHYPIRMKMLSLVSPRYRIHPSTAARLRRLFDEYRTLPVRLAIRNTSQEARLRSILEDTGLEPTAINKPCFMNDCFTLRFHPGDLKRISCEEDEEIRIEIEIAPNLIDRHLDELRVGLSRLTANPLPGRGYRLKHYCDCPYWMYYF